MRNAKSKKEVREMRKRGCAFLCSAVLLTGVFLRLPGGKLGIIGCDFL